MAFNSTFGRVFSPTFQPKSAAAVTAGNGSLTIVDEATGGVTIALHEVEMAKLALGSYHYDIQILRTTGIAVSTLSSGTFIVSADYTKATS
jgi:hypothetical protein